MSSFIHIADTHIGADPVGYHQQTPYSERIPEIIDALDAWLREHRDVECVLHGGDMIDETSAANIQIAVDFFNRLSIPTHLCLGNHDLTHKKALDAWLDIGASFFPTGAPCGVVTLGDCAIHIIPCHWCELPYFWDRECQDSAFSSEQTAELESNLLANKGKTQVLLTHNPTFGLPIEQTGFDESYHAPENSFTQTILDIVERHPSLKVVLGAHNHMNMRVKSFETQFVTASSFSEAPFDLKYFQVNEGVITMDTISLAGQVGFNVDYDFDKTFVQGRECDRRFQ